MKKQYIFFLFSIFLFKNALCSDFKINYKSSGFDPNRGLVFKIEFEDKSRVVRITLSDRELCILCQIVGNSFQSRVLLFDEILEKTEKQTYKMMGRFSEYVKKQFTLFEIFTENFKSEVKKVLEEKNLSLSSNQPISFNDDDFQSKLTDTMISRLKFKNEAEK